MSLLAHNDAMAGLRAHRLGCNCGGTDDGMRSCASFLAAWGFLRVAPAALPPKEDR